MLRNHVYLAVSGKDEHAAAGHPFPVAHLCYRIGAGCRLLRARSFAEKGGIMVIGETEPNCWLGNVARFVNEILREYTAHSFCGVVADFEAEPSRELVKLFEYLDRALAERDIPFFIPERFAKYSKTAKILISSAVTGGSLKDRLTEAVEKFGGERVALDIQRLRMDICPPTQENKCCFLNDDQLNRLMCLPSAGHFHSEELAVNYFCYSDGNSTHFVLYDDAETILSKLGIAEQLGVETAFLLYPEVGDLLTAIERAIS